MSAPHVLHVVRTLGRSGGMERNLYRVVKTTHARGIRHSIALLSDFPDIIDFGELAEVTRFVTEPNDPRLITMLRAHIRRLRPDVVHARNWGAWPDVAVARLLTRRRPRFVFSYHGMEETDRVPLKRRLAFQGLAAITDEVFAVSDAARQRLRTDLGIRFGDMGVLPNGVDTDRFSPTEAPRPEGPLVLGSSGRLHPIKNFPLILDAMAQLPARFADVRVRYAGEGPERETILERARALGLEDRVELLGHVDDVPGFLRGLDVYVLASDMEANPNALLEAMASGLPSLATRAGGSVEVSNQGHAAHLFEVGDAAGLARGLVPLLDDAAARRTLGATARAWILERYAQSRMMDAYEALYRGGRAPR